MNPLLPISLLVLFLTVTGWIAGKRFARRSRRRRLERRPFPPEWAGILEQNMPIYGHLPDHLKVQLHGAISVFVAEKNFEGFDGIEITDEIRVTIAGQACLLLLNRDIDVYPKLYSILVYPGAFQDKRSSSFLSPDKNRTKTVRLGESWQTGSVVLAWDHVRHGAMDLKDGHNLVFHEFAHQLDQADGRADGAPPLERGSSYFTWAQVLGSEYENLRERTRKGRKSVFRKYGGTAPAEFFAVATEAFFEKPRQMKEKHPDLYRELKHYYRLDPLQWMKG
jgi:Mlc titration factor MtfA (ptsG expression regulator)